jgi:hypothetical protein
MTFIRTAAAAALVVLSAADLHAYISFGDSRFMHPDAGSDSRDDTAVELATDGAGNWVAATTGPFVSRSSDNGDTWTVPVLIPGASASAGAWAYEPCVVTAGDGTWLIAWSQTEEGGGFETANVMLSRSTDNGATWSAAAPFASNVADDEYTNRPRLATDGSGNWMAAWHESDPINGDDDIRFTTSTDNGVTWAPVQWLAAFMPFDAIDQNWPDVATDGTGNWVVSYNEMGTVALNWRIKVWRSTNFGGSWSGPSSLAMTLGLGIADIDTGGPGSFVNVHSELTSIVGTSDDGGTSFGGQRTISQAYGAEQSRSRIATDGDGNWIAVWDSNDDPYDAAVGGDQDIVFAVSIDNGEHWNQTDAVDFRDARSDLGQNDGWAEIATDGAGRWIAAWERNDDIMFAISEPLCPATRRNDCTTGEAGKSSISISDQTGTAKDKLKFKMSKGGATDLLDFGNPVESDSFVLCIWDSNGGVDQLAYWSVLQPGGTCNGKPCWSATSKGFKHSDKYSEESNLTKAKLSAGEAGSTSVSVQGAGIGVRPADLPFSSDPSVAVQLISSQSNACWGATFSTPKKNESDAYQAKSE